VAITSEQEWAERAAAFLKHKLRECEVTYVDLASAFDGMVLKTKRKPP
jgi:hypothetical protein